MLLEKLNIYARIKPGSLVLMAQSKLDLWFRAPPKSVSHASWT